LAEEKDCEKLITDSSIWFTEDDICQFMSRKEDETEPKPEE
jgi:hypothetical protein